MENYTRREFHTMLVFGVLFLGIFGINFNLSRLTSHRDSAVLAEATSSGSTSGTSSDSSGSGSGGSTSASPTPTIDNSGSGSNTSGDSGSTTNTNTTTTSTSGSGSGDSSTTTTTTTSSGDSSGTSGSDSTSTTTSSTTSGDDSLTLTNSGSGSNIDSDTEKCLKNTLGDTAYNEISSEARSATPDESLKIKACFGETTTAPAPAITLQTNDEPLPDSVDVCLNDALGATLYTEVKSGASLNDFDDREKAIQCFNPSTTAVKAITLAVPTSIKSCLSGVADSTRLNDIREGRIEASEGEKVAANKCFSTINKIQSKVLPVPAEQVAFLEASEDKVKVDSSFNNTQTEGSKKGRVMFGYAPANTLVDIYIFSDPLVVTTQTDENGQFVYQITDSLTEGSHIAYATFKDEKGVAVRSAVFNFDVSAAEAAPQTTLLPENQATNANSKFTKYASLMIGVAVIFVIVGVFAFFKFKKGFGDMADSSEKKMNVGNITVKPNTNVPAQSARAVPPATTTPPVSTTPTVPDGSQKVINPNLPQGDGESKGGTGTV